MKDPDIKKEYALQNLHTFGMEVFADYFVEVSDYQEIKFSLSWAKERSLPVLILGGGSNLLFSSNYKGLVLKNALKGIEILQEQNNKVRVKCAAGENWHNFVLYCIDNGWGGIENLSLIPGCVGAAPMQNIGAYGVEIKDVFYELEALNRQSLIVEKFSLKACEFGYRESVFKHRLKDQYVILSVTFDLSKVHRTNTSYGALNEVLSRRGIETPTIKDVSEAVIQIRQSKLPDPVVIGNAGSFFKNPIVDQHQFKDIKIAYPDMPAYPQKDGTVKLAAGWLIDQCGWKGKKYGSVGVHEHQALVLVNHGGGSGAELQALSGQIKRSVQEKFGIQLHEEVNVI